MLLQSKTWGERGCYPWTGCAFSEGCCTRRENVTEFLYAYRATSDATIEMSPFQLMHGRRIRTKLSSQSSQLLRIINWETELQRSSYKWKHTLMSTDMPRLLNCTQEALCTRETLCISTKESPESLLKWHSRKDLTAILWQMERPRMLHTCVCCQRPSHTQQKNRGLRACNKWQCMKRRQRNKKTFLDERLSLENTRGTYNLSLWEYKSHFVLV